MNGLMLTVRLAVAAALTAFAISVAMAQGFSLPRAQVQVSADCEHCPQVVTLPNGLRMSQYLVTRAEFRFYTEQIDYKTPDWGCNWGTPGIAQTDDEPAICITYSEAEDYVGWLSKRAGVAYRLPSVEEYRYAASGGQPFNYWWGEDIGENRANCLGCKSQFDGKGTSPVDTFQPNPYGLFDAVGNAWQWTSDCQDAECKQHFLIGGSWSSPPADLRLTKMIWNGLYIPFYTYGLRVVSDAQ